MQYKYIIYNIEYIYTSAILDLPFFTLDLFHLGIVFVAFSFLRIFDAWQNRRTPVKKLNLFTRKDRAEALRSVLQGVACFYRISSQPG